MLQICNKYPLPLQYELINIAKRSLFYTFSWNNILFYERTIIMKKLAYLASAIFAGLGFASTASADVSVSGSSKLAYTASGAITKIHTLGTVDFGLSTTTASGMTISSGASISMSTSQNGGVDNGYSGKGIVTGWDGLTFATGGATIEIGTDVALADGVGEVDGVHAFDGTMDHSGVNGVTRTVGVTEDEGTGLGLSTSFGGASVGLAYVANAATDGGSVGRIDNATTTGASAKVSTSLGAVGVTVAYVTQDTGSTTDTESAAALTYASDMGTLTLGYGASTGTNDGSVMSAAYKMSLDADTSIALGYASYDVTVSGTSSTGTETNVSLVRALGGGASVFADFGSVSGTTSGGSDDSAIAIGTSVSF